MLLFAGYLLVAPPMFVFGPLVGLLLLSRPATLREWVWVAAATSWSLLWLSEAGGLSGQFVRAAAVLVSGSYLALTVWRPSNQLSRCLAATAGAGIALGGWMIGLGVRWTELRQSIQLDLAEIDRLARAQWSGMSGATEALADLAGMADTLSMLYPGLLALVAIAGLRLAWSWYHRLAVHPLGAPPAPFRTFGFNDQLVWGWVAAVALALAPVPEPWRLAGANLILVLGVLYAARGLAVVLTQAGGVAGPVAAVLGFIAIFLLPFVVGGLTLLGLADTWLDFRRRLATPSTGGFDR